MKKLLLLVHVVFLIQYASYGQICLGSPDVLGEQNICPGNSYKYETNAAIGFPYRFDIAEWTINSGNALIKINGTDTRFYASQYLVQRDLSANDIALIENYYPHKISFKTIGLDNDQVTLYYNHLDILKVL